MSYARLILPSAGDLAVHSLELEMPRAGAWVARGLAESDVDLPAGPATLTVGDGGPLSGALRALTRTLQGKRAFELVGGAGGLQTRLAPQFYRSATARIVLQDALSSAGETLSPLSDKSLLATALAAYARPATTVGAVLQDIVQRLTGASWRVQDDGAVWVGVDTWPTVTTDPNDVVDEHDASGVLVLAPPDMSLRPGSVIAGRRASTVVHRLQGPKLRTEVWTERPELETALAPGLRGALAALAGVGPAVARAKLYRASVLKQNADDTLELVLDDTTEPAPSRVPIRCAPGVRVLVQPGARMVVAYENGDREKAVALLGEADPAKLVRLEVGGGSAKVARVGDTVDVGLLSGVAPPGGGAVTFTLQPPTPPGGVPPAALVGTSIAITEARATSGAEALRA
jgi:hypothetical protein